jgi:capsular polysaccharide biosynthesis protein
VTSTITRSTYADERSARSSVISRYFMLRFTLVLGLVAAVLALIAAATAYAVAKKASPTFRSTAAISLDQPLEIAVSANSGQIDKLSRIRQKYIGVARYDAVAKAVAQQVHLPPGRVRGEIFAVADRPSLLLIVGANDRNAQNALRITSAFANEMVAYVDQEQTRDKIPAKDRIAVNVVVQPRPAVRIQPTKRKEVTTGIVAGLIVLLAVVGLGSLTRRPH